MTRPIQRHRAARRLWNRRRDLPIALEAVLWLAYAEMALRLLPFAKLAARLRPMVEARQPANWHEAANHVAWAVEAAAKRVPWRSVCFHAGIAGQRMLARRGIAGQLHYGVARGEDGQPAAHVWLTVDGRAILGGEVGLERYARLASFAATVTGQGVGPNQKL